VAVRRIRSGIAQNFYAATLFPSARPAAWGSAPSLGRTNCPGAPGIRVVRRRRKARQVARDRGASPSAESSRRGAPGVATVHSDAARPGRRNGESPRADLLMGRVTTGARTPMSLAVRQVISASRRIPISDAAWARTASLRGHICRLESRHRVRPHVANCHEQPASSTRHFLCAGNSESANSAHLSHSSFFLILGKSRDVMDHNDVGGGRGHIVLAS
jgi:hypothetical protein